jgi:uncharacterized membrane protein
MAEPVEARVREASVTMSAVDGESLLSPQLMARVVSAVLAALEARDGAEASRRRDAHIGGGCGGCGGHGNDGGEHG